MKIKFFILIFFSSISLSFASGGSIYTRYGIGDLYLYNTAGNLSMGGIRTAVLSKNLMNLNNPASWISIKNTSFGVNLISNFSSLSDGNLNGKYSLIKFTGFHLAFPIERDLGIGFVFGLIPYSNIKYDITNDYNKNTDNGYTSDFTGSGGISKAFLGISYLLPLDFSFGATFEYYTGDSKYESIITYNDSSDFSDSHFTSELKLKGLGTTIGFLTPDLSSIMGLKSISNLRIGLSYEISGKLTTDSLSYATTALGESIFSSLTYKTKIPNKLSIGLSLNIDKFIVNVDYLNQPWSKFEQNGYYSKNLKDLNRYSIGVEYDRKAKRFASFWELVKYRCGLSYEQSQYTLKGVDINQFGIHAGMSFPFSLDNTIDIGFMYGIRGTTDQNLLQEHFYKVSVGLNLAELWFIRQER